MAERQRPFVRYVLCGLCAAAVLLLFFRDLQLLVRPDPVKEQVFVTQFASHQPAADWLTVALDGFVASGQGLQLAPGSAARAVVSFEKAPEAGCLLRVWLYGDDGTQRPNRIRLSRDSGKTFTTIAANRNRIGTVFDLSRQTAGHERVQLVFDFANRTGYRPQVFDQLQLVLTREPAARPVLPQNPWMCVALVVSFAAAVFVSASDRSLRSGVPLAAVAAVLVLAVALRWAELVRVAGTPLCPDAAMFTAFAGRMELLGGHGFYSARFAGREPLYLFVVSLVFDLLGQSDTHLRLVSFVFSLAVVLLTWRIGHAWFSEATGLIGGLIVALHPALVELSARGLRAEFFTTLVLLLVYRGFVIKDLAPLRRTVECGLLAGAIVLTRSEALAMLVVVFASSCLLRRSVWKWRMAAGVLLVAAVLYAPQLVSTRRVYGDPFYAVNKHTRFYRNREFAGRAGFPSREDVAREGMYTGPHITPLEYYFSLHTPWEVLHHSAVGLVKIHLTMPLSLASGKGNLREVRHAVQALLQQPSLQRLGKTATLLVKILKKDFFSYAAAGVLLVLLVAGLVLVVRERRRMLPVFLVSFQLHAAFIAFLGIDVRLCVHAYPLMALCCGYAAAVCLGAGAGSDVAYRRASFSSRASYCCVTTGRQ